MRISVTHSTAYRYDRPVRLGVHVIRLRPRDDGAQKLLCHELRIDPAPALSSYCTDQDGNVVLHTWFEPVSSALEVHSRFQVETLRQNPFDFLLIGEPLAAGYPEPLNSLLASYIAQPVAVPAIDQFAKSAAEGVSWKTIAFLTELTARIHRDFRQVSRRDGGPLPPLETLHAREGACRDLAVLFCAACRSLGLASRFVSGYEREAAHDTDHAAMHAWAEVYLPGGGWRGFDPSQGLAVGTSHVSVAAAGDPELAAPISGSYRGDAPSTLATSVHMEMSD